ncbi:MAG: bifunctional hydroxymethylpyrimidine kinase/phosphomethylpyrimidine kinase [Candidatus Helarchaeales archaeon]
MKNALTIAGSDSDGMAGIQADLKTFHEFNLHGLSVITAITAQSPKGIISTHAIPVQNVADQIEALTSFFHIDGIKTGMLYSPEIIEMLYDRLHNFKNFLIIDPVMIAGSGAMLLEDAAVKPLVEKLMPLATAVMPNIHEAERITGIKIHSTEDMKKAALLLSEMGMTSIIIKGSHLNDENITDILYHEEEFYVHEKSRIPASAHGTGCVFSSAILSGLIHGASLVEAFMRAEDYVTALMQERALEKNPLYAKLEKQFSFNIARLERSKSFCGLIAEVRSNLAVGDANMKSLDDILTTEGRITKSRGYPRAIGPWELGGKHHVSRLLLTAHAFDKNVKAAMNIRFEERIVLACQKAGLDIVEIDRSQEPSSNVEKEGGTMEWVVQETFRRHGKIPDCIFDRGDFKKEPMIRVFGNNATDVVDKVFKILVSLESL